jgi:hypothetical protein
LTEEQAKIEAVRLMLCGDGVHLLFSRYLNANNLMTLSVNIQENFYRRQLSSVRLRCIVERGKDNEKVLRWVKRARPFALAYGFKTGTFAWQKPVLPSMQNIMGRLRKFCRTTFDTVPKLALRDQKIVVDITIKVPAPTCVD